MHRHRWIRGRGIGIRIRQDVHRYVAELGFWLGEEFWGHGITTEVVPAFVDYCFQKFPLHRIYAEPYANNHASARVLEKAGFVLEGRLGKNAVKDGQVLDSLLYAKIRSHSHLGCGASGFVTATRQDARSPHGLGSPCHVCALWKRT